MHVILTLETSTTTCSVAIGVDQKVLSFCQSKGEDYRHASEITMLIEQALREAAINWKDLNAVAVSSGPGSFTGLRVGASAAKGICFAHDLPLIGVSTLQIMAHEVQREESHSDIVFIPMIHARKDEYYLAAYDGKLREIWSPRVFQVAGDGLQQLGDLGPKIVLVGEGLENLASRSDLTEAKSIVSNAAMICPLAASHYKSGQFIDLESFTPTYLKDPHITIAKKRI